MARSALTGKTKTEARETRTLQSHIEDCWEEPAINEPAAPTDLDVLQGAWYSIGGRREAELLVSGKHFAFRFADGDIYIGVFELDLHAAPKTMDMRIDDGPVQHKGKTALCLYELDGVHLRWCATSPGRERLTAFPAADHEQSLVMIFRREQPAV